MGAIAFTTKNWVDGRAGGTPINAAALEDMEARLAAYTDTQAGGGLEVVSPGTVTTNQTLDMTNRQEVLWIATMGANVKFEITAWSVGKSVTLVRKQDATGGRTHGTPLPTAKWEGGAQPSPLTTAANGIDIFGFFHDGVNVYGFTSGLNFS